MKINKLNIAWGRYTQAIKNSNSEDEMYYSQLFLTFCFDLNRWVVETNYNWEDTPNYDLMEELYYKMKEVI